MKGSFFDVPLYREFVQLDANERLPDERTILLVTLSYSDLPQHNGAIKSLL